MYQFVEVKKPLIICLGSMEPVKRKKEIFFFRKRTKLNPEKQDENKNGIDQ